MCHDSDGPTETLLNSPVQLHLVVLCSYDSCPVGSDPSVDLLWHRQRRFPELLAQPKGLQHRLGCLVKSQALHGRLSKAQQTDGRSKCRALLYADAILTP